MLVFSSLCSVFYSEKPIKDRSSFFAVLYCNLLCIMAMNTCFTCKFHINFAVLSSECCMLCAMYVGAYLCTDRSFRLYLSKNENLTLL